MLKIISGFQSGVDIAAIRAAKRAGFDTGGWMPKGFKALDENGRTVYRPEYAELYGATQTDSYGYGERSDFNVADADFTLLITENPTSNGSHRTKNAVKHYQKDMLVVMVGKDGRAQADPRDVAFHLKRYSVVNVAGNRYPRLEKPVEEFLVRVFEEAKKNG